MWLVLLVAVLLGLRHATDPDHLAAVTALIAGSEERAGRAAARHGIAWGLGHATTLFIFGLPIVLFNSYLPERVLQVAETLIGVMIIGLALRLLVRWRRLHVHAHLHGRIRHVHAHVHEGSVAHAHPHGQRTAAGAVGVGLVHGMGGSAGVGVLLVATVSSTALAVVSLLLLALFTAVSMAILTGGFGMTLTSRPLRSSWNVAAPALGALSLAFGCWYIAAAWAVVPYPF